MHKILGFFFSFLSHLWPHTLGILLIFEFYLEILDLLVLLLSLHLSNSSARIIPIRNDFFRAKPLLRFTFSKCVDNISIHWKLSHKIWFHNRNGVLDVCVCLNVYVCSTCFTWAIFTSCSSGISRDKYFSLKWKIDCHPINANYFHWQKTRRFELFSNNSFHPFARFSKSNRIFYVFIFFLCFFFINRNENLYECPWKKSFANLFPFYI